MKSLFDNRYQIIEQIGSGKHTTIYSAIDTYLNKPVVIKQLTGSTPHISLASEAEALELFNRHHPSCATPKMHSYVTRPKEYIVMQALGNDIGHYWKRCNYKFSLKTVAMLGLRMVSLLESVHDRGLVHGDVNEENFVMDEQCQTLYIIDFGISNSYMDRLTRRHMQEEQDVKIRGRLPYASTNVHKMIRSSRRDDIESLAYLLIRLLKGCLPWESNHFFGRTYEESFYNVGRKKMTTGSSVICTGLPTQIKDFLRYARQIRFANRPDYGYLRELLRQALAGENLADAGGYDWVVKVSSGRLQRNWTRFFSGSSFL